MGGRGNAPGPRDSEGRKTKKATVRDVCIAFKPNLKREDTGTKKEKARKFLTGQDGEKATTGRNGNVERSLRINNDGRETSKGNEELWGTGLRDARGQKGKRRAIKNRSVRQKFPKKKKKSQRTPQ